MNIWIFDIRCIQLKMKSKMLSDVACEIVTNKENQKSNQLNQLIGIRFSSCFGALVTILLWIYNGFCYSPIELRCGSRISHSIERENWTKRNQIRKLVFFPQQQWMTAINKNKFHSENRIQICYHSFGLIENQRRLEEEIIDHKWPMTKCKMAL